MDIWPDVPDPSLGDRHLGISPVEVLRLIRCDILESPDRPEEEVHISIYSLLDRLLSDIPYPGIPSHP